MYLKTFSKYLAPGRMLSESTLVKMPHIVGNHMSWLLLFWIRIVFTKMLTFLAHLRRKLNVSYCDLSLSGVTPAGSVRKLVL